MRMEPVPADQPIPAADFFRKEFIRWPSLNDAGTHLAALMNTGEERWRLGIIELGSGQFNGFSGLEGGQVLGFSWLDDNTLLVQLDLSGGQYVGRFAVDVRNVEKAYPVLQFADRGLVGVPLDEPLKPLIEVKGWGTPEEGGVVRVDATSRAGRWVELGKSWWRIAPDRMQAIEYLNRSHILDTYPAPGDGYQVIQYRADSRGRLMFAEVTKDDDASLLHWTGDAWTATDFDLARYEILRVEDGPEAVVAREIGPREKPAGLVLVNGLTGAERQVLYREENYDVSDAVFQDPGSGKVIGVTVQREHPLRVWFADDFRKVQDLLNAGFKGKVVEILDSSRDGRVFLFSTRSDRDPKTFYSFDAKTKQVALIKSARPWLAAGRMGRTHHFQYRSEAGPKFDAYLTLPATAKPQEKLPLLVWAVADPAGRHNALFNEAPQFWASRGYAVLRANTRSAEGRRWLLGDDSAWDFDGMAADLNAAVRTAIKTGVVDADRVAALGLYDGGYLALLAARRSDSLYKAVVVCGTHFDRFTWARAQAKWLILSEAGRAFRGKPVAQAEEKEYWDARSPVRFAGELRAAVLVGASDFPPEGGVEAARDMIAALDQAGVEHEFLVFDKGRSFGRDLAAQLEFVEREEAFLKKHL